MILHENRQPNILPYLLFLKERQNFLLSSAANYRWKELQKNLQALGIFQLFYTDDRLNFLISLDDIFKLIFLR